MKRFWFSIAVAAIVATEVTTNGIARGQELAASSSDGLRFAVTVTNLTRGQTLTPVLVASHKNGLHLFDLGSAAIPELATLAEEGDIGPLTNLLRDSPDVFDVANSGPPPGGFILPGPSKTVHVRTRGSFNHVRAAAARVTSTFTPVFMVSAT